MACGAPGVAGPSSPTPRPFSPCGPFSSEAVQSFLMAWEPLMRLNQAALGIAGRVCHITALPPPPLRIEGQLFLSRLSVM